MAPRRDPPEWCSQQHGQGPGHVQRPSESWDGPEDWNQIWPDFLPADAQSVPQLRRGHQGSKSCPSGEIGLPPKGPAVPTAQLPSVTHSSRVWRLQQLQASASRFRIYAAAVGEDASGVPPTKLTRKGSLSGTIARNLTAANTSVAAFAEDCVKDVEMSSSSGRFDEAINATSPSAVSRLGRRNRRGSKIVQDQSSQSLDRVGTGLQMERTPSHASEQGFGPMEVELVDGGPCSDNAPEVFPGNIEAESQMWLLNLVNLSEALQRSAKKSKSKERHRISGIKNRLQDLLLHGESADRKMESCIYGGCTVLVTAPHSIPLRRDGHAFHQIEEGSGVVARDLAKAMGGTCLAWHFDEVQLTLQLKSEAKKHGMTGQEILNPRNRDPNYLHQSEVRNNPWFSRIRILTSGWKHLYEQTLHVDVHGCKDPPSESERDRAAGPCTEAHLTIGLGAMCARAHAVDSAEFDKVAAFGKDLVARIEADMVGWGLSKGVPCARAVIPGKDGTETRFAGVCADPQRLTQTQQSVTYHSFTHAMQLEMSLEMRQKLKLDPSRSFQLGLTLKKCWFEHL